MKRFFKILSLSVATIGLLGASGFAADKAKERDYDKAAQKNVKQDFVLQNQKENPPQDMIAAGKVGVPADRGAIVLAPPPQERELVERLEAIGREINNLLREGRYAAASELIKLANRMVDGLRESRDAQDGNRRPREFKGYMATSGKQTSPKLYFYSSGRPESGQNPLGRPEIGPEARFAMMHAAVRHMFEAADNLAQAGSPDLAKQLRDQAEKLLREAQEKMQKAQGRQHDEMAQRQINELREEIGRMRRDMDRLARQVEKLSKQMAEKNRDSHGFHGYEGDVPDDLMRPR